jgi:hypothetical protein
VSDLTSSNKPPLSNIKSNFQHQLHTTKQNKKAHLEHGAVHASGDEGDVAEKLDVRHSAGMYFTREIRRVSVVKGEQKCPVPTKGVNS